MEARNLVSIRRGQRAAQPYPAPRREWNHIICLGSHQANWPPKVATCSDPVTTAERVIRWLRQTKMHSNGATCYLNNVVAVQLWTLAMTVNSVHEMWDVWAPLLIRLLSFSYTETIDLYRDDFLGQLLTEWFASHPATAQHDAGEFAGWFRGILLAK